MPSTASEPSPLRIAAEQRFAFLVCAFDVGAAVLVRAQDFDPLARLDRFQEARLALQRALEPSA
jgi:hypothetical protein